MLRWGWGDRDTIQPTIGINFLGVCPCLGLHICLPRLHARPSSSLQASAYASPSAWHTRAQPSAPSAAPTTNMLPQNKFRFRPHWIVTYLLVWLFFSTVAQLGVRALYTVGAQKDLCSLNELCPER